MNAKLKRDIHSFGMGVCFSLLAFGVVNFFILKVIVIFTLYSIIVINNNNLKTKKMAFLIIVLVLTVVYLNDNKNKSI